jgi:hypothetical protein
MSSHPPFPSPPEHLRNVLETLGVKCSNRDILKAWDDTKDIDFIPTNEGDEERERERRINQVAELMMDLNLFGLGQKDVDMVSFLWLMFVTACYDVEAYLNFCVFTCSFFTITMNVPFLGIPYSRQIASTFPVPSTSLPQPEIHEFLPAFIPHVASGSKTQYVAKSDRRVIIDLDDEDWESQIEEIKSIQRGRAIGRKRKSSVGLEDETSVKRIRFERDTSIEVVGERKVSTIGRDDMIVDPVQGKGKGKGKERERAHDDINEIAGKFIVYSERNRD